MGDADIVPAGAALVRGRELSVGLSPWDGPRVLTVTDGCAVCSDWVRRPDDAA